MGVTIGDLYSADELQFRDPFDAKAEHLSDRQDQETIVKTNELSCLMQVASTNASLVDRVSDEIPTDPLIQEMQEKLEEIETLCQKLPNVETSYIVKVQQIVGLLLAQLNRISQKDRDQIDSMKKKFYGATEDSAEQLRGSGWNDFKFALMGLGASLLQFSPYASDQLIGKTLAEQFFPSLGRLWGNDMQARMRMADAVANMVLQEYSAKTSKGQSDSSNKQEIIGILDKVLQALREAARSG